MIGSLETPTVHEGGLRLLVVIEKPWCWQKQIIPSDVPKDAFPDEYGSSSTSNYIY